MSSSCFTSAVVDRMKEQAATAMRAAIENQNLDRELVSRAFAKQLEALKLPTRPVLFYPNLDVAAARVRELAKNSAAWDAAWGAARDAAWDAAWGAARDAAWDAAWDAARDAARDAAWAAAWAAARDAAWDAARDAAWAAAWAAARAAAWDAARDAAWDAARDAALNSAPPSENSFTLAARSFFEILRGGAFIFWMAPDAVHVVLGKIHSQPRPNPQAGMDRQYAVYDNNGAISASVSVPEPQTVARLHCENAPAIEYEDGSGLYFWKGIQVPEQVIMAPEKITVKDTLACRNAEVRRAMIERYGLDRFVLDAKARALDKWNNNELLAIDLPEDPDRRLVALKLRCPSTSAVYIIRVPPEQKTVQGALAWSFGLDRPSDYVLQKET